MQVEPSLDMPVDHHAATAIADMPFGHQVLSQAPNFLESEAQAVPASPQMAALRIASRGVRDTPRMPPRALPGGRSAGRREAVPRS